MTTSKSAKHNSRKESPLGLLQPNTIRLHLIDHGVHKMQDSWIDYFNDRDQKMISAPDLYDVGKQGSSPIIKSLHSDFERLSMFSGLWMVSSTRITYDSEGLSGRLIHNYGSEVASPKDIYSHIPVYQGQVLSNVLNEQKGLEYLRALFDTKDSSKKITSALETLAGKNSDDIEVWTLLKDQRKNNFKDVVVMFNLNDNGFYLMSISHVLNHGYSFMVSSTNPK